METSKLIENLNSLLVKYSDNKSQIEENLYELFKTFELNNENQDYDLFSELVLLAASLYELKARNMLPQDEDIDWLDEVEIIKDKDLAFARLLQFKAFSEVGLSIANKIKINEFRLNSFKYYQTNKIFPNADIELKLDFERFRDVSQEVFTRYKTIQGFKHIDKDLPDLQISIDNFLEIINRRINDSFENILQEVDSHQEAIALFLALLETIRWGFVTAYQEGETIKVSKNNEY